MFLWRGVCFFEKLVDDLSLEESLGGWWEYSTCKGFEVEGWLWGIGSDIFEDGGDLGSVEM